MKYDKEQREQLKEEYEEVLEALEALDNNIVTGMNARCYVDQLYKQLTRMNVDKNPEGMDRLNKLAYAEMGEYIFNKLAELQDSPEATAWFMWYIQLLMTEHDYPILVLLDMYLGEDKNSFTEDSSVASYQFENEKYDEDYEDEEEYEDEPDGYAITPDGKVMNIEEFFKNYAMTDEGIVKK